MSAIYALDASGQSMGQYVTSYVQHFSYAQYQAAMKSTIMGGNSKASLAAAFTARYSSKSRKSTPNRPVYHPTASSTKTTKTTKRSSVTTAPNS